jgi:hypothetical protein
MSRFDIANRYPSRHDTARRAACQAVKGGVVPSLNGRGAKLPPPALRIGKAKAITATARKLAILVYRTLKHGLVYADPGAAAYDARHRTHVIRRLGHRAKSLGSELIDFSTGEVVEGSVS